MSNKENKLIFSYLHKINKKSAQNMLKNIGIKIYFYFKKKSPQKFDKLYKNIYNIPCNILQCIKIYKFNILFYYQ